jgi:hypothetical protein
MEQGEHVGQVEAEWGSPDHVDTGEADRRRRRSRRHGGVYALVVSDDGEGFLQLAGSMEG